MFSSIKKLFKGDQQAIQQESHAGLLQVTADASRCVQCGICGHNCPVGIPVREYARRGENVTDTNCISCGACIENCPRGTLRWGPAILLRADNTIEINATGLPDTIQLTIRIPG